MLLFIEENLKKRKEKENPTPSVLGTRLPPSLALASWTHPGVWLSQPLVMVCLWPPWRSN
jgi:hypothetical protein